MAEGKIDPNDLACLCRLLGVDGLHRHPAGHLCPPEDISSSPDFQIMHGKVNARSEMAKIHQRSKPFFRIPRQFRVV